MFYVECSRICSHISASMFGIQRCPIIVISKIDTIESMCMCMCMCHVNSIFVYNWWNENQSSLPVVSVLYNSGKMLSETFEYTMVILWIRGFCQTQLIVGVYGNEHTNRYIQHSHHKYATFMAEKECMEAFCMCRLPINRSIFWFDYAI